VDCSLWGPNAVSSEYFNEHLNSLKGKDCLVLFLSLVLAVGSRVPNIYGMMSDRRKPKYFAKNLFQWTGTEPSPLGNNPTYVYEMSGCISIEQYGKLCRSPVIPANAIS
jgi:hypothetical protein